jgi:hypothetical protein
MLWLTMVFTKNKGISKYRSAQKMGDNEKLMKRYNNFPIQTNQFL